MEDLLSIIQPKSVLDCAFGTGRWIPQYTKNEINVVGIDASADMLQQAQEKLKKFSSKEQIKFRLKQGNIFSPNKLSTPTPPDLGVCIRFLNWVDLSAAEKALCAIRSNNSLDTIVGASVIPSNTMPACRLVHKLGVKWANRKQGPKQYVHDESELIKIFERLGWIVSSKRLIVRRYSRTNYFYHLKHC
ncbi:MAG: class I SAM-dependent methyltransferase [Cyanobacteria bacterium K_DeepCast_0m_m1_088]|nr:class I SAM-dependent methyltransferase [Cyanobacteria bacterium K_DeepCast_0m_m1_088]